MAPFGQLNNKLTDDMKPIFLLHTQLNKQAAPLQNAYS
jgi:hypothetical protein